MKDKITKVNEKIIRVEKTIPVTSEYTLDFLTEQRDRILSQKIRDNEQRDLELAEVDELIAECQVLKIKSDKKK
jgi:hypothetical protein